MPVAITVAREFGSGGSELGQALARRLGYRFVDHEILTRAAAELHLTDHDLAHREERVRPFWARYLDTFGLGTPETAYLPPPVPVISDEHIFATESRILGEIASEEPCVVMGRAGFRVLATGGPRLHLFVHAPLAFRVARVRRLYDVASDEAARDLLRAADRTRERFVSQMTGAAWRQAENYHLCLDASLLPIAALAAWLEGLARQTFGPAGEVA